ncbi:MAG TPA: PAS domain-containing protein, partial [Coleofasciculaceae cyanobacterium]
MLSSSLPEPTLTSEQVLDCLGAIALCIHQTQSLDCILNTAVREVHKLLHTDRVLIYRCQADGNGVVVAESVASTWTPILNQIIHDPCIETTWAEPDKQGRVNAIADIYSSDIQPCYLEFLAQFQVRANLVVPILLNRSEPLPSIQNQLWGLLIAHHCSSPRQWQPLEVNLLQQLAVQIAITIQQAELYQQAQAELLQRQEAQEELRRQQEFLRNVIDTNPNLIFVKDWDGRFTLVNQALADIYGTTVEELTGKTDAEFNSTQTEVEGYIQDDRQVMSSLQPKFIPEETLTSATGEVHYLQTVKKPLLSPDGQTRYVLATATDITKRKRAEQERDREAAQRHRLLQQLEQQNQILEIQVQERTARLRQINEQLLDEIATRQRLAAQLEEQARTLDTVLSASPDDIYMFDRAGRYLYANRGALQSMSAFFDRQEPFELSEIVGKTGYELEFPLDLMELHEARLEGVFVTGEPLTGEISYSSEGDIRYRDYIMTPLYALDGSVEKVVVTSRDISDRKRSEAALQDSNQRIISILESITDAFFALNREWHFTYLNPRAEQILQRTQAELLGKNVWNEFPEAVDLAFYQEYHKAISEQVSVAFAEFYPPLNRWFEVYAYPTPEGLTVYFRDITERKRTQEALRESQEQLEAILENSPAIIYLIDTQHR